LATVISTWGSSPCPPGSHLAIRDDGVIVGSVSAGCVESAVIHEAMQAIKGSPPQVFEYGVSSELAWEVGLACGGEIKVLIRSINDSAKLRRKAQKRIGKGLSSCLVTKISDASSFLVGEGLKNEKMDVSDELKEVTLKAANENKSFIFMNDKESYFIEAITPPNRIIIIGAVHIAQVLAPMAIVVGFQVVVIDPRKSFATLERFPSVEIINDWPSQALANLSVSDRTAIVILTHDPKIDDQVLQGALESSAFYVGALGSNRTNEKRLNRLKDMGLNKDDLMRLHGPIGLDIGAKLPAEIATAILAEIIQKMRQC
jgi:xanthine dehydrogenase accessory factor